MGKTKIEWTDKTWSPVTGCTKVSAGCKNCYAERLFPRVYGDRPFSDVQTHPERLEQPLRWRKPSMIFVNSMSDLFHEKVPFAFVEQVFKVMQQASQHTFQILTKRATRAEIFTNAYCKKNRIDKLPANIWIGVSVENQEQADKRIPLLSQIPTQTPFLSCEPLLGPIIFDENWMFIDWVIVGGESGSKARPMDSTWAISIKNQCKAAGVPFFFKQGSQNNWHDFKNFESFPRALKVREYPHGR